MGATYTRQSTYSDGDVITAAHTNDEFNQLLAAFASGTGHTHDGTSAEGGPITKLLGTSLTFGDGTAGTDITVTFDGESNDGVLKWMEDEDYFEFSDDILVASTEKLQFRDTALYINSSTDGQLDIVADTEVQIAATTIDINGAVDISGNLTVGGNIVIGSADISEAELEILDGLTVTTDEVNVLDGITSTVGELNLVDGSSAGTIVNSKAVIYGSGGQVNATSLQIAGTDLTATATEFNLLDGGSSIGTTAVSDGHGILMNHGGTMAQTTVQTLAAYLDDEITAMPNLVTTGALNSGSITSGFGTIDTGSSAITTTGLITGGSLDIDDVVINGTTIGHTDDTDLITLADGAVTIAGDLTISGDDLTMGTNTSGHIMVADGTNFNPVAVSGDVTIASNGAVTIANDAVETAMLNANVITGQSELSSAGVDITNDDLLIHDNDAGALKKVSVTNLISSAGGLTEVVADTTPQLGGDLDVNGNGIVSTSNGNIALTPNGTGVVRIDGNVDIQSGTIDLKNSGSRSKINFYCESGNAHAQALQAAPHSEAASNTLTLPSTGGDVDLVSTASTATLTNKTLTSPKINEDVALTATATELNLLDGVSGLVQADFTKLAAVDSTSTELNLVDGSSAGTIVNSKAVIYGSSGEVNATTLQIAGTSITASAADINLIDGITNGTVIASKAIITDANKDISGGRNITISGELDAATLDISGDADIDGTLEADAITVNGSTLNSVIADEAVALSIALG